MRTIWKYPIPLIDEIIEVQMPKNAKILHVDNQSGQVCLWVLVESELGKETRRFRIYGTGHRIVPNVGTGYNTYDTYLGTTIMKGGGLVWHVFEVK